MPDSDERPPDPPPWVRSGPNYGAPMQPEGPPPSPGRVYPPPWVSEPRAEYPPAPSWGSPPAAAASTGYRPATPTSDMSREANRRSMWALILASIALVVASAALLVVLLA
jgi:hypothetical protein